jgi:FAD/FMN-containing dehydrogenase
VSQLLDALRAALGADGVLEGQAALDKFHSPWSERGSPLAVLRPCSTGEVSAILRLASRASQPVVPWGGGTGVVDGSYAEGVLALSLERMSAIEEIDEANAVMRVQAGCVLQRACEAAEARDLLLPLDLGSRGSATIGGNISTNAGGNRVLRWGMMRDMVLGIEAVLADGTVITALNPLIKNNAGYDLKQLFIGSEGTLGIVTRAVLRLRPRPTSDNVGFLAVDAFDNLPRVLRRLERSLDGTLSAFEVMWADYYELVTKAPASGRPVLPVGHPYYVLVEAQGSDIAANDLRFETALTEALHSGEIVDAVVANSEAQRMAMWGLRDDIDQLTKQPYLAFDVSLKIDQMQSYVETVRRALEARWGESVELFVFGHLADGNLHLVVCIKDRALQIRHPVEELIYAPLRERAGSVSAEHGIGLQKREFLSYSRSPAELTLMRTLKLSLDPKNILNPGKVLA